MAGCVLLPFKALKFTKRKLYGQFVLRVSPDRSQHSQTLCAFIDLSSNLGDSWPLGIMVTNQACGVLTLQVNKFHILSFSWHIFVLFPYNYIHFKKTMSHICLLHELHFPQLGWRLLNDYIWASNVHKSVSSHYCVNMGP